MKSNGLLVRIAVSLMLLAVGSFVIAQVPAGSAGKPAAPDDFLKTPVGRFADLLAMLPKLPPGRIAMKIDVGGLSFKPTLDQVQELKNARAAEVIIEAFKARLPPPPPIPDPPKPVPPKKGHLIVGCAPVDCEVFISGTSNGKIAKDTSTPFEELEGEYTVRAVAPDYEADPTEKKVMIRDKAEEKVEFHFKPTEQALRAAGVKLFASVVDGLGGEAGLKDGVSLQNSGTMTVYGHDGQSEWNLVKAILTSPEAASFTVSRGGSKPYTVSWTAAKGYEWGKKKPTDAAALDDVLRRLGEFQIAAVVSKLKGSEFRPIADRLDVSQPLGGLLKVQGPETYVFRLGENFRPQELTIESNGLNNGLRVLYSEYMAQKTAWYPRSMEIILADTAKHGVKVHYAEVAPIGSPEPNGEKKKKGKFLGIGK